MTHITILIITARYTTPIILKATTIRTDMIITLITRDPCIDYSGGSSGGSGGYQPQPNTNQPCTKDPIKNPTVASSGASGQAGGMFGCVRIGSSSQCDYKKKYHDGIDIASAANKDVYSMYNGTVVDKRDSFSPGEYAESSYGNYITIRYTDANGTITDIKYNHLNSVNENIGDTVDTNTVIGKSGNTGNAASAGVNPHIHIQVLVNNTSINPSAYFATSFNEDGSVNSACN